LFSALRSLFRGTEHRSTSQFGSLQDPLTALLLGGHGPTMSGINISSQTALRCSVVFGSVKVLSETVGELPLKLYRKRPIAGAISPTITRGTGCSPMRRTNGRRPASSAVDDGEMVSRRQRLCIRVARPGWRQRERSRRHGGASSLARSVAR
jgi:hypothetical protein